MKKKKIENYKCPSKFINIKYSMVTLTFAFLFIPLFSLHYITSLQEPFQFHDKTDKTFNQRQQQEQSTK